ncbi:ADAMTS-like protein 5 isoform X2 [Alosa alosa]|uniref:ADAMTS-like protein 5 isoform X2 n=1 Tax=Alosa alosa TaxID=278164 RepID=UPI002015276C|nr:ADAMTS-like protein 5 isoform X2 [Alosa alosa]
MSAHFNRKLFLCQTLTFIILLLSPLCLWAQHSSRVSVGGSVGAPRGRVRRQPHFRNEWSGWSGWSVCSRSCGGGASVRTRTCITRNPVGGPCVGDSRQYKICNTKECPVGEMDFREMQCKAFDDRPVTSGSRYKWTTFHGGSDPCELSCLAVGHNFYYNFGRVLDGTPCQTETTAVCVNGKCLEPGCDLILGSKQEEDACMVCGGHNSTCLHHRNIYQNNGQDGPFGYNEVTMIPAGATHIRVTDNSRNYLALQNGRSQFVINGNWKISTPGEYSVAGTKLLYRRSADTWESFEVPGPTKEDLHIMVLSTDKNTGIEYEYWLPPDRFALYHGRRSPLRQPHHAGFPPWVPPTPSTTTVTTTTTTTTTTTIRPHLVTRPYWAPVGGREVNPYLQHQPYQPPRRHLPHHQPHHYDHNHLPEGPRRGHCGRCRRVRGRSERQRQYCEKDFVFRAQILEKRYRGEETRYDVQVIHTYRNRYRLEHREFLWVPNVCDCPALEEGRQYVLMVRRHINYERTLDRILLEEDSYVQPYRPREHSLLKPLEELCSNRGPLPQQPPAQRHHHRRG